MPTKQPRRKGGGAKPFRRRLPPVGAKKPNGGYAPALRLRGQPTQTALGAAFAAAKG